MNVIKHPNRDILFLLGKNPFFKEQKYRLNKYCLIHQYKDVKLIFNMMTRSFISITNEEFERIYEIEKAYNDKDLEYIDFLINAYFLVHEDYKEDEITDWLRTKYRPIIDDNYLKECYDFVLFPTTTCNARCFYCYENPMKKMPMKKEMAERVVKYMMNKGKDKKEPIKLRWFGGEPLFNVKIIRYICETLKEQGYNYISSMISNGYIFDDELVKEARENWNLGDIQITLDGTEEVYNKAKNYIYKNQDEVSPFKKVIDNIGKLLSNDVHVSVRMNAEVYNCDDLKKLVRFLHEKFNDDPKLGVYIYPIFEDKEKPRTEEEKKILFEKIWEVEEVLKECGFLNGSTEINNHIRATHCMTDNGKTINIHPDGTLGVCEHYIDSDCWGHIDEEGNEVIDNWNIIHEWREYLTDDLCKNCPLYPDCIRTRKCDDLNTCNIYMQEFRVRHEKINMEAVYNNWLKNENNCTNSCGIKDIICAANENDGTCYCVSQRCYDKENWCLSVDKEITICAANENDGTCYCVSQRCDNKENWCLSVDKECNLYNDKNELVCAANENDGTCYCVSQRCDNKENWCLSVDKERGINNSNGNGCYCVSQRCENKENWCYCISQKEEVEGHKCNGGSCTYKKEEKQEEQKVKKSLWEKIKDIFD